LIIYIISAPNIQSYFSEPSSYRLQDINFTIS